MFSVKSHIEANWISPLHHYSDKMTKMRTVSSVAVFSWLYSSVVSSTRLSSHWLCMLIDVATCSCLQSDEQWTHFRQTMNIRISQLFNTFLTINLKWWDSNRQYYYTVLLDLWNCKLNKWVNYSLHNINYYSFFLRLLCFPWLRCAQRMPTSL